MLISLLVLTTGSCSEDGNRLIVDLRTDLAPGIEFGTGWAQLTPDGGAAQTVPALVGDVFSAGMRVAEWDALAPGMYTLSVAALDNFGTAVVAREVRVDLRGDLAVTVVLSRSCREVVCPGTGDLPSQSTCAIGRCVEPECSELTPDACGPDTCSDDAMCTSASACGVGTCVEGGCLDLPDDSLCAPDEVCQSSIGCVPRDVDAGPMDAGVDAADAGDAGDAGFTETVPQQISDGSNAVQGDLKFDGTNLGVLWLEAGDVWFRLVSATTGEPLADPLRVTDGMGTSDDPELTSLGGAGWGTTWTADRDGTLRVFYRPLTPDGTPAFDELLLTPMSGGFNPKIDFSGSWVGVSWLDTRHGTNELYFARMTPAGASLGELRVTTSVGDSAHEATVAWIGTDWLTAWRWDNDIYYQRVDNGGRPVDTARRLDTGVSSSEPRLSPGEDGTVGVLFEDDTETTTYFIQLEAATGMTGTRHQLSEAGNATKAKATYFAGGWDAYWGEVVGGASRIRARRVTAMSAGLPVEVTTEPTPSSRPEIVWTGRSVAVLWEDERDVAQQMWVQLRAPL